MTNLEIILIVTLFAMTILSKALLEKYKDLKHRYNELNKKRGFYD